MAEQLFYGRIGDASPVGNSSNSYIRLRGDFTIGSNVMTNIVDQSGYPPLEFVRAGQTLRASGPYSSGVTISSVDVGARTLTLETNAASTTFGLARISPGLGEYYIESASLQDPQQLIDYGDITGSDDANYNSSLSSRYAILGKSNRSGTTVPGRFHLYEVVNVYGRNGGNNTANLYIQWAESGSEANSGDVLVDSSNQNLAIVELSTQNGLAPIFKSGLVSNFSLAEGEEVAAYQLALSDFLENVQTGSGGGSDSTPTFPFTGSAIISGSLGVTGSTDIDGVLSLPGISNVSASLAAAGGGAGLTQADLDAITGSLVQTGSVNDNTLTFTKGDGSTFDLQVITSSGGASLENSGVISSSLQIAQLDAGILSSSLQIADDISGSFTQVSASLSASIADIIDGTIAVATASYAISSSHEIVTEVTSSFATTASFALTVGTVQTASNADTASILANALKLGDGIGGGFFDGRIDVTASIDTGSDYFQTGSRTAVESFTDLNLTGSLLGTSSYALTASYALNIVADTTVDLTSLNNFTSSISSSVDALNAATSSYLTSSGSVDFSDVTNKPTLLSSSQQIAAEISGAFNDTQVDTSSLLITASVTNTTMSFTKGDASTFEVYLVSSSFALTASHALNATAESASYATTASHALTASYFAGTIESASYAETASYVEIATTERFDFVNTASITVDHSLESEDVLVQAYETNGGTHLQSIPEDVEILSNAQVKVSFAVATSGYIVVGRGGFLRGGVQDSASFATTSSHALTASYALNAGGGSGDGFPYTGSAFVTGSLNVTGSVSILSGSLTIESGSITADNFVVGEAAVGNPVVSASATLTLHAGNAVAIDNAPLRLAQFTDAQTGSIVAQDGDMIWNTDRGMFMGYSASAWFEFSLT